MRTTAIALDAILRLSAGDPQPAIESLRSAVALNPHDARYWLDLAAAYQVTGDVNGQRSALDQALAAEPTAPNVAWEAANFFLVDGDIDRALREFRVVIENDIRNWWMPPSAPAGVFDPTRTRCSATWYLAAPIRCFLFSTC